GLARKARREVALDLIGRSRRPQIQVVRCEVAAREEHFAAVRVDELPIWRTIEVRNQRQVAIRIHAGQDDVAEAVLLLKGIETPGLLRQREILRVLGGGSQ